MRYLINTKVQKDKAKLLFKIHRAYLRLAILAIQIKASNSNIEINILDKRYNRVCTYLFHFFDLYHYAIEKNTSNRLVQTISQN